MVQRKPLGEQGVTLSVSRVVRKKEGAQRGHRNRMAPASLADYRSVVNGRAHLNEKKLKSSKARKIKGYEQQGAQSPRAVTNVERENKTGPYGEDQKRAESISIQKTAAVECRGARKPCTGSKLGGEKVWGRPF